MQYSYLIPGHCSTCEQRRIHGLNGEACLRMILYAEDIIILCNDIDELTDILRKTETIREGHLKDAGHLFESLRYASFKILAPLAEKFKILAPWFKEYY